MAAATQKGAGTLVVVVLKARNLRDKHTFTKQDPFAVLELGNAKEKTDIDKRGGQHPIWDQDLHLLVPSSATKANRTLKVQCYAKEAKEDDLIGSGEIDITETLSTGEFDDWVKLEDNGTYRGEVYLEITFFASGPRPLARRPSKLSPSERLWRPPQTPPKTSPQNTPYGSPPSGPPAGPSTSPKRSHLVPPKSSRTPSPSAKHTPLPTVPEYPPDSSRPLAGESITRPPEIPSILRPGGGRANPAPISVDSRPTTQQTQAGPAAYPEYNLPDPQRQTFPSTDSQYQNYMPGSVGMLAQDPYVGKRPGQYDAPPPLPSRTSALPGNSTEPRVNRFGSELAALDPYLDHERAALGRASQEEADAELARIIAQNEGIDLNSLRREETDRELARKLARELNAGILENERRNSRDGNRASNMPGGWR